MKMESIKIDFNKIENVEYENFDYDGKHWTCVENGHGQNVKGLWMICSNGEKSTRIYKADLLKTDQNKAFALFHPEAFSNN